MVRQDLMCVIALIAADGYSNGICNCASCNIIRLLDAKTWIIVAL